MTMFDRSADRGRPLRLTVYGVPPHRPEGIGRCEAKVGEIFDIPIAGWTVQVDLAAGPFGDELADYPSLWDRDPIAAVELAEELPAGSLRDLTLAEVIGLALTEGGRHFLNPRAVDAVPALAPVVARYLWEWCRARNVTQALDELGLTNVR